MSSSDLSQTFGPLDKVAAYLLSSFKGATTRRLILSDFPNKALIKHARQLGVQRTIITPNARRGLPYVGASDEHHLFGQLQHLLPCLDLSGPSVIVAKTAIGWSGFMPAVQTLSTLAEMAHDKLIVCFEVMNNHLNVVPRSERAKSVQSRSVDLPESMSRRLCLRGPICTYDRPDIQLLAEMSDFTVAAIDERNDGLFSVVLIAPGYSGTPGARSPMKFTAAQRNSYAEKNEKAIRAMSGEPLAAD